IKGILGFSKNYKQNQSWNKYKNTEATGNLTPFKRWIENVSQNVRILCSYEYSTRHDPPSGCYKTRE
ncbi:hypothetical protein L9F63_000383, partial [Diploptera punctata]